MEDPEAARCAAAAGRRRRRPSLAILAIYSPEQFRTLLRSSKPIGGRDIPKMSWMPAVGFTDREFSDLYGFLRRHHGLDGAANPVESN